AGPWRYLGLCDLARGRYDSAIESFEQALRLNPQDPLSGGDLGLAYHLEGMETEALEAYLRVPVIDDDGEAALRRGFAENGWAGLNRAFARANAVQQGRPCGLQPAIGAHLYARAGDSEEMYRCLEQAIAERGNLLLNLKVHRSWDPYREEPRFQEVLARVGLAN
ncbi:MAG: TPR end-of-group domain-containing protein, partial [Planctomycetota bacterium]